MAEKEKDAIKETIKDIKTKILESGCPKCKGGLDYIGYNKFKCKAGCGLFKLPIKRKKDMTDSRNWKATCCECGGTMVFQKNIFRYYCPKCGNILEV